MYQDQIHVPMVIKLPHQTTGGMDQRLASSVDVVPTVAQVLGRRFPGPVDGVSLVETRWDDTRSVLAESFPNPKFPGRTEFHRSERAIVSGHYKFIQSRMNREELYHLGQDRSEQFNLVARAGSYQELASRFRERMHDLLASLENDVPDAGTGDPESVRRLRSLGYVR